MTTADWSVIGAGPAGMLAIGKLLDAGIKPNKIAWIDPNFTVGDFGNKWRNVPSNTKVDLFIKFFQGCKAFESHLFLKSFELDQTDPNSTCPLALMADPLQHLSKQLQNKVDAHHDFVSAIAQGPRCWTLQLKHKTITSKNIILAPGSTPKTLEHECVQTIPMATALDQQKLKQFCDQTASVAVFGASHSAVLIMRFLIENGVKQVINFYLSPLKFATQLEGWTLFDDTGLKGSTALWAREHLQGNTPANLKRYYASEENIKKYLSQCQKAAYAVGFKRREIPIEGYPIQHYNHHNGIVAPGIFGLGIAYPEGRHDRFGTLEMRVGLWKFLDYIDRVMPIWMQYGL